jgi:hypothetical protein
MRTFYSPNRSAPNTSSNRGREARQHIAQIDAVSGATREAAHRRGTLFYNSGK